MNILNDHNGTAHYYQATILLLVVVLMSLSACESKTQRSERAGQASETTPSSTSAPTSTALPAPSRTATNMPSPAATSTPTLTPEPTATTAPSPTPTPTPRPLTEEEVSAALLTEENFPTGWSAGGPGGIISVEMEDTFAFLCRSMERRASVAVEARFRGISSGPFVTHSVMVYSAGEASSVLDDFRQAVETCDAWEAPLHFGEPVPMHQVPWDFPTFGEDTLSVATSTGGGSEESQGLTPTNSIFILRDDVIILITHVAQSSEDVDETLLETLAERALERLDIVLATGR